MHSENLKKLAKTLPLPIRGRARAEMYHIYHIDFLSRDLWGETGFAATVGRGRLGHSNSIGHTCTGYCAAL